MAKPCRPRSDHRLEPGDLLLVESSAESLLGGARALGLAPTPTGDPQQAHIPDGSLKLAEVILAPKSKSAGKTLAELDFRVQYGLNVLALRHAGATRFTRLAEEPLQFGDSILVEGSLERVAVLHRNPDFLILDTYPPLEPRRTHKAPLTVGILLAGLVMVTTRWLPVPVALLIGAILMVSGFLLRKCVVLNYTRVKPDLSIWRLINLWKYMLELALCPCC